MENIIENQIISDVIIEKKRKSVEKIITAPKGVALLCHAFFLLLGICQYIPISFIAAANNFWLYKFRTVDGPDDSASSRNKLQVNFASSTVIITTTFSLLLGIFNTTVAHRFRILYRLFLTLSLELTVFVLLTISVKVDTDGFQVIYFGAVLTAYAILASANTVNILAAMNLYPRFPTQFMGTCLAGQGAAGIVGDILNIVSIGIFKNDITKSTSLYFTIACSVIASTIGLLILLLRTNFFKECLSSIPEKTEKQSHSFSEIKSMLYKIRFPTTLLLYLLATVLLTHTSVTSLVVSEHYEEKTLWAVSYFSPVMTFLLQDIASLTGRIVVSVFKFDMPEMWFYILGLLRIGTVVPFIWLCNAQPRHHLPLLFPHDYQYGLIVGTLGFTNGIIVNCGMMLTARKVENDEADLAYTVLNFAINLFDFVMSPLGALMANAI